MTACIFDLDGVIVDTAKYHFLAWKKLANELGVQLTEQDNKLLKGVGRIESLNIILEMGKIIKSPEEKEKLAAKKNTSFIQFVENMKEEEIFDGVKNLFVELRANGKKIGLASSSKNARTVLDKLRIHHEFDAIMDGNMIVRSKPDPEIFLKAANLLQTLPKDCVVIEDAVAGVESAIRAGMKCICIGSPGDLGKANLVVDHIEKLNYEIINKL